MPDLAQFQIKDPDDVELSFAHGEIIPDEFAVTVGITVPKIDHGRDAPGKKAYSNYLTWYKDGGFVVTAGLTQKDLNKLRDYLDLVGLFRSSC